MDREVAGFAAIARVSYALLCDDVRNWFYSQYVNENNVVSDIFVLYCFHTSCCVLELGSWHDKRKLGLLLLRRLFYGTCRFAWSDSRRLGDPGFAPRRIQNVLNCKRSVVTFERNIQLLVIAEYGSSFANSGILSVESSNTTR